MQATGQESRDGTKMRMTRALTRVPGRTPDLPVPVQRMLFRQVANARPNGLAPVELVKLHHSLETVLPADGAMITQFVSADTGEGTEEVAYDLAWTSAALLGKRVLFVNATKVKLDLRNAIGQRAAHNGARFGGFDLAAVQESITQVVGMELYQLSLHSIRGAANVAPALGQVVEILTTLRHAFDMIVVASPPATVAPLGALLAKHMDGTVLVLQAERTRVSVAESLRDSLAGAGGTVAGVVLTQYRSYVPRWLRRWF